MQTVRLFFLTALLLATTTLSAAAQEVPGVRYQ